MHTGAGVAKHLGAGRHGAVVLVAALMPDLASSPARIAAALCCVLNGKIYFTAVIKYFFIVNYHGGRVRAHVGAGAAVEGALHVDPLAVRAGEAERES